MGRIRSLHPGQWTDAGFVRCSPLARLLALGLRNEADDRGIFKWDAVELKMRLLPVDTCDVAELLVEIEKQQLVARYTVGDQEFGIIRNFLRWQSPRRPSYVHPVPKAGDVPERFTLKPPNSGNGDGSRRGDDDHNQPPDDPPPDTRRKRRAPTPVIPANVGKVSGEGEERRGKEGRGESPPAAQHVAASPAAPPLSPDEARAQDPAIPLIQAFDAAIVSVFGEARARPHPAGSDLVDARRMANLGVTPQLVGDITRTRCDRLIATAKAPPGSLRYVVEACVEALADRAKAPNGASAAATSTGQSPDEQWLGRLRSHAKSGQWFRNSWGAPPGEPGCQVPAHVLDQFGAEQPPQAEG